LPLSRGALSLPCISGSLLWIKTANLSMTGKSNKVAAANRHPVGQSDGSDNLSATVAADRAFSTLRGNIATEDGPVALSELARSPETTDPCNR
jgi:hypothetical protein